VKIPHHQTVFPSKLPFLRVGHGCVFQSASKIGVQFEKHPHFADVLVQDFVQVNASASSKLECTFLCLRKAGCLSFFFGPGVCALLDVRLQGGMGSATQPCPGCSYHTGESVVIRVFPPYRGVSFHCDPGVPITQVSQFPSSSECSYHIGEPFSIVLFSTAIRVFLLHS